MTNLNTPAGNRLHYLDAVRAGALLLGIVFHASLSFMPIFIGWAVMDINTSNSVGVFALISHSFRMELFFLIAGFFACLSVNKHGIGGFIRSRVLRIGVPFIIGWIALRPLIIAGWTIGGQSMQGDVDVLAGLANGLTAFNGQDILVGTHLWFLYYLLLITFTVLAAKWILNRGSGLSEWIDNATSNVANIAARFSIIGLLCVFPIMLCLWFMNGWGVDTPDKSLWPMWPVFALYGGFFVAGWLVAKHQVLLDMLSKFSWWRVALCCAAIMAVLSLSGYESQRAHDDYMWLKLTYLLSYALMMCLLVTLSLAICRKLFARGNKVVSYIADASYWMYLIHLPLVVWLQVAVAELPWHWGVKLLVICSATVMISLAIYDACIRSTFVGSLLNGKRASRFITSKRS